MKRGRGGLKCEHRCFWGSFGCVCMCELVVVWSETARASPVMDLWEDDSAAMATGVDRLLGQGEISQPNPRACRDRR